MSNFERGLDDAFVAALNEEYKKRRMVATVCK